MPTLANPDAAGSQTDVAFVAVENDDLKNIWNAGSKESLLNADRVPARPIDPRRLSSIQQFIGEKMNVVLPVYNQERDIGRTLEYVIDRVGVPPEHITTSSGSTDGSNAIIREHGVEVVELEPFLKSALNMDAFLDLMAADSLKGLRGKGLTMLGGHLSRHVRGKDTQGTFTLQTDTDIKNIGTGEGEWDPLTHSATQLSERPDIDAIKAAKNGRNNQPMHIGMNALQVVRPNGYRYHDVSRDRWILTGEYGWKSEHIANMMSATGYAVETILAMSQVDLGMKRAQVEMREPRRDGQNFLTKETVMYSDIQMTAMAIAQHLKRMHELSLGDIRLINEQRAKEAHLLIAQCFEPDQDDPNDGSARPNEAVSIQPSRLTPPIKMLVEQGIVYSGR